MSELDNVRNPAGRPEPPHKKEPPAAGKFQEAQKRVAAVEKVDPDQTKKQRKQSGIPSEDDDSIDAATIVAPPTQISPFLLGSSDKNPSPMGLGATEGSDSVPKTSLGATQQPSPPPPQETYSETPPPPTFQETYSETPPPPTFQETYSDTPPSTSSSSSQPTSKTSSQEPTPAVTPLAKTSSAPTLSPSSASDATTLFEQHKTEKALPTTAKLPPPETGKAPPTTAKLPLPETGKAPPTTAKLPLPETGKAPPTTAKLPLPETGKAPPTTAKLPLPETGKAPPTTAKLPLPGTEKAPPTTAKLPLPETEKTSPTTAKLPLPETLTPGAKPSPAPTQAETPPPAPEKIIPPRPTTPLEKPGAVRAPEKPGTIARSDTEDDVTGVIPQATPPPPLQTYSTEKREKDSLSASAGASGLAPTALGPDANPLITPPDAPVPSAPFSRLSPQVQELFEKTVGVMTVMHLDGLSQTSFTLSSKFPSSVFSGTQIIIEEFQTAPGQLNVRLVGSDAAVRLLQSNVADLVAAFQSGNYNFKVGRIDINYASAKNEAGTVFKRKEAASGGGDKDNQGQRR